MTEKTFSMATMKVKLASKQTLSAKLTADARMTAEMDLLLKGDKGDKGGTKETEEKSSPLRTATRMAPW